MIPNCTKCGQPEKPLLFGTYCDCEDREWPDLEPVYQNWTVEDIANLYPDPPTNPETTYEKDDKK